MATSLTSDKTDQSAKDGGGEMEVGWREREQEKKRKREGERERAVSHLISQTLIYRRFHERAGEQEGERERGRRGGRLNCFMH